MGLPKRSLKIITEMKMSNNSFMFVEKKFSGMINMKEEKLFGQKPKIRFGYEKRNISKAYLSLPRLVLQVLKSDK